MPETTERISIDELKSCLNDPDYPLEQLRDYLIEDPENSEAFNPALRPNPALVDGVTPLEADMFLGIFNSASRKRRQKKCRKKVDGGWTGVKIVSEGDSWFQYPVRLDDVIDQLFDRYAIYSLGGAGRPSRRHARGRRHHRGTREGESGRPPTQWRWQRHGR